MEVIIIKNKTLQEWLPIKEIDKKGVVKLKNNNLIKIIKVNPINYNLKSDLEKESILNSYKIFLKTCNFDIQILIQSNKEDLSHHINNIQNNISKKENKYLEKISKNYIQYINKINSERKSSTKDFYIIISKYNFKTISFLIKFWLQQTIITNFMTHCWYFKMSISNYVTLSNNKESHKLLILYYIYSIKFSFNFSLIIFIVFSKL